MGWYFLPTSISSLLLSMVSLGQRCSVAALQRLAIGASNFAPFQAVVRLKVSGSFRAHVILFK